VSAAPIVPAAPAAFAGTLRTSVFRCGERPLDVQPGLPTGHAALDAQLPGGGWPVAGLTEVLCDALGVGEVSLLLPALATVTRTPHAAGRDVTGAPVRSPLAGRGVLWIAPPHLPYAPALAAAGLELARLAIVRPPHGEDAYWAAEQALRSGACGAVLLWAGAARGTDSAERYRRLRRLQLAAQAGGACGFVISPAAVAVAATPAALRLRVQALPDGRLEVSLVKRRGLARPVCLALAPRRLPLAWRFGAGAPESGARPSAAARGPDATPPPRGRDRTPAR
jgi:cell division inhibitor SulA/protein ImuA